METQLPPGAPASETHFDRASWLILLGVLAFVAVMVGSTVAVLLRPGDGWLVLYDSDPPRLTSFYGDWPTPLQAGDAVLAVNDAPLTILYSLHDAAKPLATWRAGGTVVYTVERGGQRLTVPVELHTANWAGVLRAMAHTAQDGPVEWSWPLIALIVFWRRPRSLAAQLLLIAMVSHAAVVKIGWATTSVSLYLAPTGLVMLVLFLTNFWSWLFWPTIIWLVLSFPLPVWPWARWPRGVVALLYGPAFVALLITLVTGWTPPVLVALLAELLLLVVALGLAGVNAYGPRAGPVARAQASWVLLGFGLSLGLTLLTYLLAIYIPAINQLPDNLAAVLVLALPVCLAIAILRYRLFDINIIIRRTLLYAVLTALLAGVYLGLVVILEGLLRPLTGQGQNQIAIVVSTLVIAALFGPLRRRVQNFIDRRFDRRTYNAAQTLAAFSANARAETDLATLEAHLVRVTDETMRPAHVGLWVRPDGKSAAVSEPPG